MKCWPEALTSFCLSTCTFSEILVPKKVHRSQLPILLTPPSNTPLIVLVIISSSLAPTLHVRCVETLLLHHQRFHCAYLLQQLHHIRRTSRRDFSLSFLRVEGPEPRSYLQEAHFATYLSRETFALPQVIDSLSSAYRPSTTSLFSRQASVIILQAHVRQ
jgi:hypothetical protein